MASLPYKAIAALALVLAGCSQKQPDAPSSSPAINAAAFAIVETELSPATLVHSQSKYLELFDTAPTHLAFATRNGTATIGDAQLPAGHVKFDQTFAKNVETYRGELTVRIPVKQASGPFDLAVTSQGCADAGICYPPMERVYHVTGAALHAAVSGNTNTQPGLDTQSSTSWYERATSADYAQSLLQGGGFFAIVGLYFVAGIVLSLLPCSYPMIPILSAIIIGEGPRVTRSRGFALSLAYVVGMALVYTVLGIAAALVGQSLGAWLQNPWCSARLACCCPSLHSRSSRESISCCPSAYRMGFHRRPRSAREASSRPSR